MSADFNEHSQDAMLSRILQRMDYQDQTLARIETIAQGTSGRVDQLERERWYQRGVVAAVAMISTACWQYFTRK